MTDQGVLTIRHTDKRSMVDLYAGLGGASEAMIRTGWDVLRIDNNPLLVDVENMVLMNLKKLNPVRVPGSNYPKIIFPWDLLRQDQPLNVREWTTSPICRCLKRQFALLRY